MVKSIRSVQISTDAERVPALMHENQFRRRSQEAAHSGLVDCGLGAAEVNYAAIPADLLETIFVVVRNTRRPEYVSDFAD